MLGEVGVEVCLVLGLAGLSFSEGDGIRTDVDDGQSAAAPMSRRVQRGVGPVEDFSVMVTGAEAAPPFVRRTSRGWTLQGESR